MDSVFYQDFRWIRLCFRREISRKEITSWRGILAILFIAAPISRGMAMLMDPLVNATLGKIGSMISVATTESPIIMGIMLGGLITVISTSPLSSMALTAMLGLTGLPMAIGSLAVAASAPMNFIFFKRLKICSKKDTIAVAIEPLTQADVVSANPIPIYMTNFVGGALAGIITSLFQLVNNAPGTASPIPGLLVLFGFNDVVKVTIALYYVESLPLLSDTLDLLCSVNIQSALLMKFAELLRKRRLHKKKSYSHRLRIAFLCCVTVNEIISAVFNISAQLELYRRFLIYRRNSNYIGDFSIYRLTDT